MILVSGCLAGLNCKYNGGNNENAFVRELVDSGKAIMVCPEVYGGLETPRDPSEILGDRVVSSKGKDVTKEFALGAKRAYNEARLMGVDLAILKAKSPSCSKGKIYDGSFSGKLIDGNGIFAEMLLKDGIKVFTEKELEDKGAREEILRAIEGK